MEVLLVSTRTTSVKVYTGDGKDIFVEGSLSYLFREDGCLWMSVPTVETPGISVTLSVEHVCMDGVEDILFLLFPFILVLPLLPFFFNRERTEIKYNELY